MLLFKRQDPEAHSDLLYQKLRWVEPGDLLVLGTVERGTALEPKGWARAGVKVGQ